MLRFLVEISLVLAVIEILVHCTRFSTQVLARPRQVVVKQKPNETVRFWLLTQWFSILFVWRHGLDLYGPGKGCVLAILVQLY